MKNWKTKEKGPIENELYNLVEGLVNVGLALWSVMKAIGLFLWQIYCWIARIRVTTKLKPQVTFALELILFAIVALIPILNLYIDKVHMKDTYNKESWEAEQKWQQEIIKAEVEGYTRGAQDAEDSLRKEGWVKMKD